MKDQKRTGENYMIKLIFSQPPIINFYNGNFKRRAKKILQKMSIERMQSA